jgi:hypothetical protein
MSTDSIAEWRRRGIGASLANLRDFLVAARATVVCATTIGVANGSTKLAPKLSLIRGWQEVYGQEFEQ